MGPGQNILTLLVGSGQIFGLRVHQVSHLWFGFGFGKFPLKITNFQFFCSSNQQKILMGRAKKYPGQSQASLLFTADQKYARVGSGPISTKDSFNHAIMIKDCKSKNRDLLAMTGNHLDHKSKWVTK